MNGKICLLVTDGPVELKILPVQVQDCTQTANNLRAIYRTCLKFINKIWKKSTCNWLDFETLESWPMLPKISLSTGLCRWVCISGKRIKKPRISTSPTRPAFSACLSPAGRQWMRKRGLRGPRSLRKEPQIELQLHGILGACLGHGEGMLELHRSHRRPRECIKFDIIIFLAGRSLKFSQSHKAIPRNLTRGLKIVYKMSSHIPLRWLKWNCRQVRCWLQMNGVPIPSNHLFPAFMTRICGDKLCVRKMDGHYSLDEDKAPDRVDSIHGHCKIYHVHDCAHQC